MPISDLGAPGFAEPVLDGKLGGTPAVAPSADTAKMTPTSKPMGSPHFLITEDQRRRRVEPLAPLELDRTAWKVARESSFPIPKIVQQVLNDTREHWRQLALALKARCDAKELRTLLITGSLRGEGYTTVSLALAIAMSELAPARVLLIDGDFSSPTLGSAIEWKHDRCLANALQNECPAERAIVAYDSPAIHVLALRQKLDNAVQPSIPSRMQTKLNGLRNHYDLIIIDGGAIFSGHSSAAIAQGIDAALLVRRPEKSSEHLLHHADTLLLSKGVGSLGVIENCVDM